MWTRDRVNDGGSECLTANSNGGGDNTKVSDNGAVFLKGYIFAKVLWASVKEKNAQAVPSPARTGFANVEIVV